MRATITELMHANVLEVFNERDSARRRATIEHIYADDIRWTGDDGVTTGRAALDAKAVELQAKLGDLQFIAAGPVYQTLGLGYLAFQLVKPRELGAGGLGIRCCNRARRLHRRVVHRADRSRAVNRVCAPNRPRSTGLI
jgi:hypothetical protein